MGVMPMMHPQSRVLSSPSGGVTLRLAIIDEFGSPIAPDDTNGLIIRVYANVDETFTCLLHVGIPLWVPHVVFVAESGIIRPYADGDYDGYSTWKPGVIPLGDITSSYSNDVWTKITDKLTGLGAANVTDLVTIHGWAAPVAMLKADIVELQAQIENELDTNAKAALILALSDKHDELDLYFHGLTTIGHSDVAKKTTYSEGEFVIKMSRDILKNTFGLKKDASGDSLKFYVQCRVKNTDGYWPFWTVAEFHPGTWLTPHVIYGNIQTGDSVSPGRYEIQMLPIYHDLRVGVIGGY